MSRRSPNRAAALAAALAAAGLIAPSAAQAARFGPLTMGPLYVEPSAAKDPKTVKDAKPAKAAPAAAPAAPSGCAVRILEIRDTRRDPQTLGANFRAIQAPADREAWLRSVFEIGLKARGFDPSFGPAEAGAGPSVTAKVQLKVAWLSFAAMNKAGDVVMRVSTGAPSAALGAEKTYRGGRTGLLWTGSQTEYNDFFNQLFADALDAMAADLRPLCAAPASAKT
jgi:hypothetical protein